MHRSTLPLLAIAAFVAVTAPAAALTLQDAMAEVAGMYCAGSTCTSSTDGTRIETVIGTETLVGSETRIVGRGGPASGLAIEAGKSSVCTFGNGRPMLNVSPITCSPNSLALNGGGTIARKFPTYTEVETSTDVEIATRTTITKELIYNGPNTDRAGAWSVVTTTATVDCPC